MIAIRRYSIRILSSPGISAGYERSMASSVIRTMRAITAFRYHFLSAGTMNQGAHRVLHRSRAVS